MKNFWITLGKVNAKKNYESFIADNIFESFNYAIDGKIYNIMISSIIELMNKSKEDFINICKNNCEFIHGVVQYFEESNILNKYEIPIAF